MSTGMEGYGVVDQTVAETGGVKARRLVKLDGNGDVVYCTAKGDDVYGVTVDDADNGNPVAIQTIGAVDLAVDGSGGNLAAGDQLSPGGANGKAIIHDGASGTKFAGEALKIQDGTADGEVSRSRLYADRTQAS